MRITQLDDNDGRKVLQIEAPWSEIEADYRDLVEQYSKVRLSGFRQGKVPRSVIEKRFRREIMEDLADRCAQRLGREAIRETGIEALGPVEAKAIECVKGKPFRFQVRFHPMPEIALPGIGSLKKDDDSIDARDWISRRLLELVPFEVPGELVRQELELDGLGESDPASEPWRAAAERIRLMLILKKIARQEGIEVDENDVNKRITERAEGWGESQKTLRWKLEEGRDMARLRDMLLAERTLEYLVEAK